MEHHRSQAAQQRPSKLKQEPDIDVVLIDYHMQDVNGLALAAQLRKSRPDDLQGGACYSEPSGKGQRKVRGLGVTFIGKPATPEKSIRLLRQLIPRTMSPERLLKLFAGLRSWTYRRKGLL